MVEETMDALAAQGTAVGGRRDVVAVAGEHRGADERGLLRVPPPPPSPPPPPPASAFASAARYWIPGSQVQLACLHVSIAPQVLPQFGAQTQERAFGSHMKGATHVPPHGSPFGSGLLSIQ